MEQITFNQIETLALEIDKAYAGQDLVWQVHPTVSARVERGRNHKYLPYRWLPRCSMNQLMRYREWKNEPR